MKEYVLFIKPNGDAELYCGGQIFLSANEGGIDTSVDALRRALEEVGEKLEVIHNTGVVQRTGEQTFMLTTSPMGAHKPEPENCYEGRCKHPKNPVGSCLVYLTSHPPQRDC